MSSSDRLCVLGCVSLCSSRPFSCRCFASLLGRLLVLGVSLRRVASGSEATFFRKSSRAVVFSLILFPCNHGELSEQQQRGDRRVMVTDTARVFAAEQPATVHASGASGRP